MKKSVKRTMTAVVAAMMAMTMGVPALADVSPFVPVDNVNGLIMPVVAQMAPLLIVHGETLTDAPAAYMLEDGSWMVPLRAAAEGLGYTVTYRPEIAGADVQKDNQFTTVYFGKNSYFFNRVAPFELESAPVLKPGTTFVPLSFFEKVLMQEVVSSQGELIIGKDTRPIRLGVDVGEEFPISLNENSSTGFAWSFTIEPTEGMTVVTDEFVASAETDMIGVAGTHEWVFRVDVPGEYTITFVLARSFGEAEVADTLVYQILAEDVAGGTEEMTE